MGHLEEDFDRWDDLTDEERDDLRALLEDLGLRLDVRDDPDAFE